ncbi:MAG: hypothetical protein NUV80_00255 [Candidatus Berkelbacteria bacterium]|nr:hypothetical protein [Candidatus Berkelbacteria bacterium]MCR4306983.1 hypothetical protein [Candidatus Berkelbacteria bacterium]
MNKPQGKANCKWTPELAYAIGLIVTDGCLYSDGRHLNLTSKDLEQVKTFARILGLKNKIGKKASGSNRSKDYYNFQFGDVNFYRFLVSIGVTPNKTKTIGSVDIPKRYFRDFLRGHFDGDGCTYSYYDPRWQRSFLLYLTFISASKKHMDWICQEIMDKAGIQGRVTHPSKSIFQVRFAKYDSMKLFEFIYYMPELPCLTRKRLKFAEAVATAHLSNKLV